jgi:hypothetical protein
MRRTIFTAGFLGLLGAAWAIAEEANTNATAGGPKREQLIEDIKAVAWVNLDAQGIAALQAAFAKGIKPLPEDNENTKSKPATPECCRFRSQS